jgi:hypothetical protein
MNLQELMNDDVQFSLDFEGDNVESFDYNFSGQVKNYSNYNQRMSRTEIEQLRENCKKLIKLTDWVN